MFLSATAAILSVLSALGSILITIYLYSTERQAPKFTLSNERMREDVLVSVIVTARNEEKVIGRCLDSLTAQTYHNLEIVVVDDESTDGTATIVEPFSRRDRRVRLVRGGEKPMGWIGKSWACQRGYENSKGEWLLFVDADSEFDSKTIGLTLSYALSNSIDMFSISPNVKLNGPWSNATMPLLAGAINLLYPMVKVNDKKSKRAYVFGTFILTSRKSYEAIGGHKEVRSKLVEDAALAHLAKSTGHNLRVERGNDLITTEWETDSRVIYHGLERVFSDSVRPYGLLAVIDAVILFFLSIYPILVVVGFFAYFLESGMRVDLVSFETLALITSIVSIAGLVLTFSRELKQTTGRIGPYPALYLLGAIMFILAIITASFKVSMGGRFEWKGSRYSEMQSKEVGSK